MCSVLISEIIHSDSFDTAKIHFQNFIRIYGSPNEDVNLYSIIGDTDDKETHSKINLDEFEDDDDDDNELFQWTEGKMKSSLYYQKFNQLKDMTLINMKTHEVRNKFYSESIIKYVVNYLMVYFSVWSAAGIATRFGILRDSNATAENAFKILKHQVLTDKKMLIPRFTQKNEEIIRGN